MNQHNDFAIEKTESHQPFFTVAFTNVLAGDRKVVPNCLCALEVQAAVLDVVTSLRLVPRGHEQIVATICSDAKGSFAPVEPRNQRGLTSCCAAGPHDGEKWYDASSPSAPAKVMRAHIGRALCQGRSRCQPAQPRRLGVEDNRRARMPPSCQPMHERSA